MFGLSLAHMILLGAIALIVIGPKQLPEVARTLGRFLNEVKRVTSDVTKTIVDARDSTDEELRRHPAPYNPAAINSPTESTAHADPQEPEAPVSSQESAAPHDTKTKKNE